MNSAQGREKESYRMLNFTVPHLLHWRREGSGCAAGAVGLARSHRGMVATQKESARALCELELELTVKMERAPRLCDYGAELRRSA